MFPLIQLNLLALLECLIHMHIIKTLFIDRQEHHFLLLTDVTKRSAQYIIYIFMCLIVQFIKNLIQHRVAYW